MVIAMAFAVTGAGPGRAGATVYEGFGGTATGGPSDVVVRVTNLDNDGPGSLREALSGGDRTIVFDVGGEILLTEYPGPNPPAMLSGHLTVSGGNITIDGFTAPPPGITIVNRALVLRGDRGAHNVIVRGLRFRDARQPNPGGTSDNIQIGRGASRIVLSHISTRGASDGNLDIAGDPALPGSGPQDVTVAWSIIGRAASHKAMLIKYGASRITLHHNLFVQSPSRNPSASVDDFGTPATDTTLDMRNNVVWDWGTGFGTLVHGGARANVVRNYFASPTSATFDKREALWVCAGSPNCLAGSPIEFARAFIQGNVQGDGLTRKINGQSTEAVPFPAPAVTTTDACAAAHAVLAGVGPPRRDAVEEGYIDAITLPGCAAGTVPSTTSLVSSANPADDRSPVTFTATVAPVDTNALTPAGTVTFLEGDDPLKTVAVAGGQARFSTGKLRPGPHSISAVYSGDAEFAASESETVVQTVLSVGGSRRTSRLDVRADLEPCCDLETGQAAGQVSHRNQVRDNVLVNDAVTIAVSVPIPTAGVVDEASARAAVVRVVFTRDSERYAECFLDVTSVIRRGGVATEARYQGAVDMKRRPGGQPVIRQGRGECDVDIAQPLVQPGVPDAQVGDVITVVLGVAGTPMSALEGVVRRR
jgi:hypothetical protein